MNELMQFDARGTSFSLLLATFTIVYFSLALFFFKRIKLRREDKKRELHEAISVGLLNGQLESLEDFVNVYRGIHNSGTEDVTYKSGLGRVLRQLLVKLASNQDGDNAGPRALKIKIKEILNQIETDSPYADLPTAERNLVTDIFRYMQMGDKAGATQKLKDLAGLIEVRQDAYERLQSSNKWSMPLAVIGLILTIVFGVISFLP